MNKILSVNYEKLPLSTDTLKGMHLTIDDQKWIKLLFDRQDELNQDFIKTVYDINKQDICNTVKNMLDTISIELRNLHAEIKEVKVDIKFLHVIAEKNQLDIKQINGDMQQMKKDILEHAFRLDHRI